MNQHHIDAPRKQRGVDGEARKQIERWIAGLTWADPVQIPDETAKILAGDAHADALVCAQFIRTKTTW